MGGGKHRTKENMYGKTEAGVLGLKILKKTLEIINYFLKLNPSLKYCIENPKALMRHAECMKNLDRYTCCYCKYNFEYMKPTDIWANFPLELKMCSYNKVNKPNNCHHQTVMGSHKNRKRSGVQRVKTQDERYKIPSELTKDIFKQLGFI
jgi:hypothetical protein